MSLMSCCENFTGLRGISAPASLAGIRPVDIWKSTAAAPVPTSEGACDVPCALMPWQLEQVCSNSDLPWAMSVAAFAGAAAEPLVAVSAP